MLRLLSECTRSGYPPDYLMARIRGRMEGAVPRAHVDRPADHPILVDDTLIWDSAARTRRWIYLQMENNLREPIVPLFLYFELETLIYWLRIVDSQQADTRMIDLEQSLLSEEVKKILLSQASPAAALGKMEKIMRNSALAMNGLVTSYEEGGVQGCEEFLRRKFLEQVVGTCRHPEVSGLFRKIIDQKNILTLAKCLRWKVDSAPGWIAGGHIRMQRDERFPAGAGLETMVRRFTGRNPATAEELDPVNLEPLLHDHLTRTVAGRMRSDEPVECCLGYIWQSFSAARKQSAKHHTGLFADYFKVDPEKVQ